MFNLEQSIAEWRKQMSASGIKSSEALDELQSHLRDDVDQQVRSGLDERQAFEKAVQQIGHAAALKTEFKKIGGVASALQKQLRVVPEQAVFVLNCLRMKWAFRAKLKALHAGLNVPLPSLDDFNTSAKQSLALAHEGAHQFHHDFIGTEHVLLGLLQLEQGAVPNVLRRLRVDHQAVRTEIEKIVRFGPDQAAAHDLPYTPRARKALALAAQEAKALSCKVVGAEHVFLGLLLEGSGVAALVLKNLGVQIERTREEIRKELSTNPGAG